MDTETSGMAVMVEQVECCRACGGDALQRVLDFGEVPLANRYVRPEQRNEPELMLPLSVNLCPACSCVQLAYVVDPKVLYADYLYRSGSSGTLKEHFEQYASEVVEWLRLPPRSRIIGIGGNDGTLEAAFQRHGMTTLNIEPSKTVAAVSRSSGVETIEAWFTPAIAEFVADRYGQANVITCNNVFAHVPDINGLMTAVDVLLKPDGWLVIESADLTATLRNGLFDQFYHEHVFYWHLYALKQLVRRYGMAVEQWETNDQQGGSFRAWIRKTPSRLLLMPVVRQLQLKFDLLTAHIHSWCADTGNKLSNALEGYTTSCYGWPAKATLLAYLLGLNRYNVLYAVDDMPSKQGMLTPGTHIPIVSRERFLTEPTDFCLLTASNYADRIIEANPQYKGKWIKLL